MPDVKYGNGKTEYGPGVLITLSGEEMAKAVMLWLHSQDVIVRGPATIRYDGEFLQDNLATVYVDPSGFVIADDQKFSGRGPIDKSIRDCELSVRAINVLEAVGITTLEDITRCTKERLLRTHNLSPRNYKEIVGCLESHGLSLLVV